MKINGCSVSSTITALATKNADAAAPSCLLGLPRYTYTQVKATSIQSTAENILCLQAIAVEMRVCMSR